jgi:hypothetical protein
VSTGKGKRLYLTLPPGIYDALERWAEVDDNKPATLAAFLIEKEVREAQDQRKIPPARSLSEGHSLVSDLASFLAQLAQGETPAQEQLLAIANQLRLPVETLTQIAERMSRGEEG